MKFKAFPERNFSRPQEQHCVFANKFLDDALGGIYPDDLVVITAKTGAGKTEMVSQIAQANSVLGKKVHMFALEAYEGEIEDRIVFRMIAQEYYREQGTRNIHPRFQDWVQGRQNFLSPHEAHVRRIANEKFKTLNLFYRDNNFNVETFHASVGQIEDRTDLIIVDHLHHFDLESNDEVRELKLTIKKIRDLMLFYRKPTVLVAHIRKSDKRSQGLLPDIEELHGSSEISKVATKIIAAGPAYDVTPDPGTFPTYLRILKNRQDGSVTRFIACSHFNIRTNSYEGHYGVGLYQPHETEFKPMPISDQPSWVTKEPWEARFGK